MISSGRIARRGQSFCIVNLFLRFENLIDVLLSVRKHGTASLRKLARICSGSSLAQPLLRDMLGEMAFYLHKLWSLGLRLISPKKFLKRFSRVTSSGKFVSEIDGLRFIAIGSVVLFHLAINLSIKAPATYAMPSEGNWLAAVARNGFHGVELFFIISGFILAYPFASHYLKGKGQVVLKQYFLRRVTRLEPPYILCMLLLFFLFIVTNRGTVAQLLPHVAASLVYLHNLVYGHESTINNVAWSLEIEIQFYLLVPLLSMIFIISNKFRRRCLITSVCLLSITSQLLFISPNGRSSLSILKFIHFFLIGFLLADIYLLDWKESPEHRLRWDLVSLVGWPLLFIVWNSPEVSQFSFSSGNDPVLAAYFFPLCAFFLYCAAFKGALTNRIITNPWITTIGGMCYTIYLFHNKLIGVIIGFTKDIAPTGDYSMNLLLQGLLVVPIMLIAAAVYFLLIERPCMRKDSPRRLLTKVQRISSQLARKVAATMPDQAQN
jgi:peptidoglycan/LPS O-acetylase OafA/YrhL